MKGRVGGRDLKIRDCQISRLPVLWVLCIRKVCWFGGCWLLVFGVWTWSDLVHCSNKSGSK